MSHALRATVPDADEQLEAGYLLKAIHETEAVHSLAREPGSRRKIAVTFGNLRVKRAPGPGDSPAFRIGM
jgi:transcription antitermination factor NusA-like protein